MNKATEPAHVSAAELGPLWH